jgi:GTP cyclohydrolase I
MESIKSDGFDEKEMPTIGSVSALVYLSGNAEKRTELERIAADARLPLTIMSPPLGYTATEIQGTTEQIAREKCLAAYRALGRPVVVEDIALYFDALGGLPGPYVRDFLSDRSLNAIHALVSNGAPGLTARSTLALTVDGRDVRVVTGDARCVVRDPAAYARQPSWYPLAARDTKDDARRGSPCDAWPCAAEDADAPCLHRVRAFDALARSLRDVPLDVSGSIAPDRRALPITRESMALMAQATKTMLACLGEDVHREGLLDTPMRVAKAMVERTRGQRMTLSDAIGDALFSESSREMVIVRDIEFFSMCEHHLLPFMGKAHVGYLPTGKIIGLSKIPRIVEMFSDRFQVQEGLTRQIAECIGEATGACGVGVVIQAQHMCMCMRGVRKTGSTTVTRVLLGDIRDNPVARQEFLALAAAVF